MYTLNRLFFLSLGIVFLMVIPFFWGSVAYNFTALENFIVKITQSKLVGYPIPELFGMSQETDLSVKVLYLERILSVVTFFYGAFFIGLSFIPNGQKRWKFLALLGTAGEMPGKEFASFFFLLLSLGIFWTWASVYMNLRTSRLFLLRDE